MDKLIHLLVESLSNINPVVGEASSVLDAVEKSLNSSSSERYVSKRFSPGGYVCSRFKAAQRLSNFKLESPQESSDTMLLFLSGTAAHDLIQGNVLSKTGQLFGNWECKSCGTVVRNSTYPQTVCANVRKAVDILGEVIHEEACSDVLGREDIKWRYKELYYKDTTLGHELFELAGFSDGIWLDPDGSWRVLEIKSTNTLMFSAMSKVKNPGQDGQFILKPGRSALPLSSHINQCLVYAHLAKQLASSQELKLDPNKCMGGIILYINRDDFSMKEYNISYNDGPYIDLLAAATNAKHAYDEKNYMLAAPKCSNKDSVYAKRCPLRLECFPRKVKATKASKT